WHVHLLFGWIASSPSTEHDGAINVHADPLSPPGGRASTAGCTGRGKPGAYAHVRRAGRPRDGNGSAAAAGGEGGGGTGCVASDESMGVRRTPARRDPSGWHGLPAQHATAGGRHTGASQPDGLSPSHHGSRSRRDGRLLGAPVE